MLGVCLCLARIDIGQGLADRVLHHISAGGAMDMATDMVGMAIGHGCEVGMAIGMMMGPDGLGAMDIIGAVVVPEFRSVCPPKLWLLRQSLPVLRPRVWLVPMPLLRLWVLRPLVFAYRRSKRGVGRSRRFYAQCLLTSSVGSLAMLLATRRASSIVSTLLSLNCAKAPPESAPLW